MILKGDVSKNSSYICEHFGKVIPGSNAIKLFVKLTRLYVLISQKVFVRVSESEKKD